jgi:microcystin-dependent protein
MPAQTPNLHIPYPVPDDSVDVPRDMQAMANAIDPVAANTVPAGSIVMFPGAVAPTGWKIMGPNALVDAASNPVLASIYGQTGGIVTLPNMQDYFPTGAGTVPLGQTAGANSVALTGGQMPAHQHAVSFQSAGADRSIDHLHSFTTNLDGAHQHWIPQAAGPAGNVLWSSLQQIGSNMINIYYGQATSLDGAHQHSGATNAADRSLDHTHGVGGLTTAAGSGTAHENRPLSRALNFIIKLG